MGKYVPAPVDAILTDAEKEALEILLRRKRSIARHEGRDTLPTRSFTSKAKPQAN
jgi:hypothetical protein